MAAPQQASFVEETVGASNHTVWGDVESMSSDSESDVPKKNAIVASDRKFTGVLFRSGSFSSTTSTELPAEEPNSTAVAHHLRGARPTEDVGGHMNSKDDVNGSCDSSEDDDQDAANEPNVPCSDQYGTWSEGSVLHIYGTCKPCAWIWKTRGCAHGASCVFCHFCDAGAHKRYRKARLAGLRANRRKRKNKGLIDPLAMQPFYIADRFMSTSKREYALQTVNMEFPTVSW